VVDVDIMVRSMGPISEADMVGALLSEHNKRFFHGRLYSLFLEVQTFSMDCYFRQTWRDTRLAHHQISSTDSELSLSVSMLNRIWKYLLNWDLTVPFLFYMMGHYHDFQAGHLFLQREKLLLAHHHDT